MLVTPAATIASASDSIEVVLNGGYLAFGPFHQELLSTGSPPPTRYRLPCTTPPARLPRTSVVYV